MKNFTNAKDAYNPNLEVFRTNEEVRKLKDDKDKGAVILRNVAIFDLTDSEKEILIAKVGADFVDWKRISTMTHHEKEMNSLENTFFKPGSLDFNPEKLIHFFYAKSGSEEAIEKAIDNDGNNLTLVNLCFQKGIQVCKLKYDGKTPLVSFSLIEEIDSDTDGEGNPISPVGGYCVGDDCTTTESIAKKGIIKKYV